MARNVGVNDKVPRMDGYLTKALTTTKKPVIVRIKILLYKIYTTQKALWSISS